jgi:hypothetical protein
VIPPAPEPVIAPGDGASQRRHNPRRERRPA